MRLPRNVLTGGFEQPRVFLCQTDKTKIAELPVTNFSGVFKWNSYNEVSFDVGATYFDTSSGEQKEYPYYNLVDGLRYIYVENFGYYQIQGPSIVEDGISETKSVTAYSIEYALAQRYLETFYINTGAEDGSSIDGVVFYNATDTGHSLLNLVLREKAPDWRIGHVDTSLINMKRSFEIDEQSIYDFLMNDVADTIKCIFEFDTETNTINAYAENNTRYDSDVFVTYTNLANQFDISYNTDDIKTVLTVEGADDLDIRFANVGLPYLMDLSYYHTVEWMGQDLYDAYASYVQIVTDAQPSYNNARATYLNAATKKDELSNRLNELVNSTSVGKIEDFIADLYQNNYTANSTLFSDIQSAFTFISSTQYTSIKNVLFSTQSSTNKINAVNTLIDLVFAQLGLNELDAYIQSYKGVQEVQASSGMADKKNDGYYLYYANYIMLQCAQRNYNTRKSEISAQESIMTAQTTVLSNIAKQVSFESNFTEAQLTALMPFLREDTYSDDNFLVIESDTEEERVQTQTELMNAAATELSKISRPQLTFSATIANLFAMTDFEPLWDNFALGKMIHIQLRSGLVKVSRLMEINISFSDLNDFSVTFGDLLSSKSQTDIHADLLSQAITAAKTVVGAANVWSAGASTATNLDKRIQQGLLDTTTQIKSIDGNQQVLIDKYGIHLYALDNNGSYSMEQGWITNNKFLYSDDGFESAKSVFGQFLYDSDGDGVSEYHFGLLADAVIAGYIEGSTIRGGTIQIDVLPDSDGNYENAFSISKNGVEQLYIDADGNVVLDNGAHLVWGNIDLTDLILSGSNIAVESEDGSASTASEQFKYLRSQYAYIENLTTTNIDAINGRFENIEANYIKVDELEAHIANIDHINADSAFIKYLEATLVTASEIDTETLRAKLAEIDVATIGSVFADSLQALISTTSQSTIDDAYIQSAIVNKIYVGDLLGGTISTNKFTIISDDGTIKIQDSTQYWYDKNGTIRMQAGQDANGDFTFSVFDASGTGILIDSTGVHDGAIANELISERMLSTDSVSTEKIVNNAITSDKIDWASFSQYVNEKGSEVIDIAEFTVNQDGVSYKLGTMVTNVSTLMDRKSISVVIATTSVIYSGSDITLTGLVYNYGEDVTSTIDASAFVWTRQSGDSAADTAWNNQHKGVKSVVVSDLSDTTTYSLEVTY